MPHPDQIADLIAHTLVVRTRIEKAAQPPVEPDGEAARAARSALNRASAFLQRAVDSMREAHDEASIAAFVESGEAARLVI